MKASLIILGLACFVGALNALPLQDEKEIEIGTFLGVEPELLPAGEEEEIESDILPELEENEIEESEMEFRPTTVRPQPTRRPRPPQIHDNAYRSQGPMSARLTNVVLNRRGIQKTLQKNRIEFNVNTVRRALEALLGNEENEDNE